MRTRFTVILICCALPFMALGQSGRSGGGSPSRGNWTRSSIPSAILSYSDIIAKYADRFEIDPALIAAIIRAESNGNPNSCSRSGAMGLMQLMPGTAAGLGVTDAYDPDQNIRGGSNLIANNLRRYKGDLTKALAAYNAGGRRVDDGSWMNISETRNYVANVQSYYRSYSDDRSTFDASQWSTPKPRVAQAPSSATIVSLDGNQNYLDLMFSAIQGANSGQLTAENGSLDGVADAMLKAYISGSLSSTDFQTRSTEFVGKSQFEGKPPKVTFLITSDIGGFAQVWRSTASVSDRIVGLSHAKSSKGHLWMVVEAGV
ncbi:hypothetical protein BH11ARM1_BH11ARM1_09130 [soil metagenome]